MKCGFCGSELENGAQFCPNCGMIISLDDSYESATENSDTVVESVYNVFKSNIEKQQEKEAIQQAVELQADPTEEKVEFVMSLPEFDEYSAEPIKSPETLESPDLLAVPEQQETVAEQEAEEEIAEESTVEAEAEEIAEEAQEDEMEDIYSYSSEEIREQEEAEDAEASLDIKVPEVDVIYEGPEKAPEPIAVPVVAPKNEKLREQKQAKENLKKISPDKKQAKKSAKKAGKKKGVDGIKIEGVLGIAIALILVLFACVYAVKNDKIPVLGELFGNESTTASTTESTTKVEWTESRPEAFINENGKKIYEDADGNYYYYDNDGTRHDYVVTTEEPSSEEDTTEEPTTEEPTTEPSTEATTETTTEATTQSTTVVTTTNPTTTKPTTTKPVTTRPVTEPATKPVTNPVTTTKPVATTKPAATTDRHGINDVTVKKPASYLAKSYTAYVTAEGVNLRSKPTADSERVLFLSKGADVVVLAKENGFLYIKSNRYGVYGWVSASYVANERPQSESVVQKGTVTPDKKYDKVEIKYTTNGLNVRKGPSTSYDIVGLVPISYPVKVVGYKSDVSGWVYVQDTTYGYTGWVSTAYLK